MIDRKLTIANDDRAAPMNDGDAPPDHVRPFMLEKSQLRGRIGRLPNVADAIIKAHHYPEPIARLLAEALCLTTLLAGMLKFDGIFTLQAKGKGVVKTLVCDMMSDGTLRGYAGFDADALTTLPDADFQTLTGGGYLAFTVDQAAATDRYQGIVALDGETLTQCVLNYFTQSEQITTAFVTEVAQNDNGQWITAALMLQNLAREGGIANDQYMQDFDDSSQAEQGSLEQNQNEDWRRAMLLMQTAKRAELLDPDLPLNTLLFRLFHEEGVRVFTPIAIRKGCRCSIDKITTVLESLSPEEKADYAENGVITMTCEFCNTTYEFPVTP